MIPLLLYIFVVVYGGGSFHNDCEIGSTTFDRDDDVRYQQCLRRLGGSKHRHSAQFSFNCSVLPELRYTSNQPFARGTKKDAFRAVFRGTEVVVKKARDMPWTKPSSTHIIDKNQWNLDALQLLRDEALLLAVHGDAFHPRLLGSCLSNGQALNVVERLTPWRLAVDNPRLSWSARVRIALDLCDLLDDWRHSSRGPVVHCDFYTFQLALRPDLTPVVIDLDSLEPVPFDLTNGTVIADCPLDPDVAASAADRSPCSNHCYRGRHYRSSKYGHFAPPWESFCHPVPVAGDVASVDAATGPGRCAGYGSEFNTFTVCRVAMHRLFVSFAGSVYKPPDDQFIPDVKQLLDECGAQMPRDRPKTSELRRRLQLLLTSRKQPVEKPATTTNNKQAPSLLHHDRPVSAAPVNGGRTHQFHHKSQVVASHVPNYLLLH